MSVLPALFLLTACGTGVAGGSVTGQYTCTDSVLDAVNLMPGSKARATATLLGETRQVDGSYTVQGDKVTLTVIVPLIPPSVVFTKSGNTLNAGSYGTCTKR